MSTILDLLLWQHQIRREDSMARKRANTMRGNPILRNR
jgi:hypothetical protein